MHVSFWIVENSTHIKMRQKKASESVTVQGRKWYRQRENGSDKPGAYFIWEGRTLSSFTPSGLNSSWASTGVYSLKSVGELNSWSNLQLT